MERVVSFSTFINKQTKIPVVNVVVLYALIPNVKNGKHERTKSEALSFVFRKAIQFYSNFRHLKKKKKRERERERNKRNKIK